MPANEKKSALDSLSKRDKPASVSRKPTRRTLPAWLLPFGLVLGFLLILGLLFGKRLLPAIPVKVAPVITIRSDREVVEVAQTSSSAVTTGADPAKSLLFQASGWIEPDPFTISVSTLVSGIIDEVYVLEGQTIAKGQKLAKLIDEDAILDLEGKKARAGTLQSEIEANLSRIPVVESRRKGSESNIETARGRLAELEDRLRRIQSLPRGSIAAVELTSARLQFEQQRSNVDKASSDLPGIDSELLMVERDVAAKRSALREAEVEVARAQLALDRHIIRSPMDGIVLRLHSAPGRKRMIQADDPTSGYIVEMYDPQKLQSRIDVPLTEASSISVGQPVEMTTDLLPNVTMNGEVTRITGEADLQRNTLQVKVSVKNPDSRLRPEMLVRGKFYPIPKPVTEESEKQGENRQGTRLSIYVPEEAIFNNDQVWTVTGSNTADLRSLTLGTDKRDGHQLAIDGVRSGEMVILPPHTNLKQGAKIKITL